MKSDCFQKTNLNSKFLKTRVKVKIILEEVKIFFFCNILQYMLTKGASLYTAKLFFFFLHTDKIHFSEILFLTIAKNLMYLKKKNPIN